jgi:hypothetical protein
MHAEPAAEPLAVDTATRTRTAAPAATHHGPADTRQALGRMADHLLDQRTHRRGSAPGWSQGRPQGEDAARVHEPVRRRRGSHGHRQPRRTDLRPRGHRAARLALRARSGLPDRVRAAFCRVRVLGAPRRPPPRPVAHVEGQVTGLRHTVMLGVTGILVGTVFLTSIFVQTVMGYSAIRAGVAFVPFALAITVGTALAKHALAHGTPRTIAAFGLVLVAGGAVLLAQASAGAAYATDVLPGLVIIGLGVGMVFVPVSVTALAGIPPQHAGTASGFLMTRTRGRRRARRCRHLGGREHGLEFDQPDRRRDRVPPRIHRRRRYRRRAGRIREPADAGRPSRGRGDAHAPLKPLWHRCQPAAG